MITQRIMFAVALAIGVLAFSAYWCGYIPPNMRPDLSPYWRTSPEEPPAYTAIFVRSKDGAAPSTERTLAVRTDGTSAEFTGAPTLHTNPAALRRTVSLPDGTHYMIFPPLRLLARSRQSQPRWHIPSDCTAFADAPSLAFTKRLGEELYLGYRAVRIEMETTLTHRTVSWMIPALGCLEAKRTTEEHLAGGGSYKEEERAIRIIEGEPDPAYFAIPDGYSEVSPALLQQRLDAYVSEQCPSPEDTVCAVHFLTAGNPHRHPEPEL